MELSDSDSNFNENELMKNDICYNDDVRNVVVIHNVSDNMSTNNVNKNQKASFSLPPKDLSLAYVWAFNRNACPINVYRFKMYLTKYDSELYNDVVDIVQNSVHIPSSKVVDSSCPIPPNQKSTKEYEILVDDMLMKELKANRIAGPFVSSPPGLIISPLGAVPKKEAGKIRIIHNLSYPLNDSVNSNIPREMCAVDYELIDVCISIVASIGKGCNMAKADLTSAFRLLRVSLPDLHFLGFTWKGLIYFDK
ncbi:MAG: hypothetical protein GY705_01280, partial [Bacteroidetes bacterium]|nr:hypothetical protein [Bacteroidota bacterium]